MKQINFKQLLLGGLLMSVGAVQAQVFKIKNIQYNSANVAATDAAFAALEDEVNANLPDVKPGDYTKGIANATAMAGTGTSAVYGASFDYALIGTGVGLGADLGENSVSDLLTGDADVKTLGGFGAQGALVVGVNPGAFSSGSWFGIIDPKRLRTYLSFMKFEQTVDSADINFTNFGVVGQYRILDEQGLGLNVLKWNGVDITTGLRYQKMKFEATQTLSQSSSSGPVSSSISGPITFGADVSVYSIPLEVSTSVRLLYVLNLIGGVGGDLNFGSAEAIAEADTVIQATSPGGNPTAEGVLDLGGKDGPALMNLRGFAGVGFEYAIGSLNLTVNKSLTAGVWGVNFGANFFW